ncbi:unnamed protein product (macronuclear) [Paramecium tetraurelia]|uniref:Uncharacterized protein n=1 Tax=Paramecium tetraurelia TaxID=5888 RepID=A0CQ53_PARTE|nr:uncharacterized protein GSPATT00009268001 [Paramecium tetraurelia]CAK72920.1 unnamed protein product [Paramecium tetraurelia]|eukprot:XP_001440317.1 hypothetical protein (macronuclear) [Paramecium tetraurelia strain d4-2]
MRQTPFQNAGQQSFNNPAMQMVSPPSQLNSFMNDYDQLVRPGETTNRRPRSRELDMMNLLLIGSMNKGDKRSGLEGLDQFLGSPNTTQQSMTTTNSLANFGQQLLGQPFGMSPFDPLMPNSQPRDQRSMPIMPMPQQFPMQQPQFPMQQPQFPMQQPQFPFQQPQFPMQQPQLPFQQQQFPMQQQQFPLQPPQLPFNQQQFNTPNHQIKNQEKLLINGQMGVTVNQTTQQPPELQEQPKNRIIDYIARQNEVLEKLTKNMATQREKESQDEKQKLLERMKKLEAQNAQDAFYNDMYDEVPPHMRQGQQFKPPPGYQYQPYFQQQNLYQQQFPTMPYPEKQKSKQQTLQMLRMLKQLKITNQRKKNKKNKKQLDLEEIINDQAEVDSFTSEESDPEPRIIQKPRVLKPRPIPPPPTYDPKDDEIQLKKLIKNRGKKKLYLRFIMLFFYVWKYWDMKKIIQAKKQYVNKEGPEILQKFMDDSQNLFVRVLKTTIDELLLPNLNIQVVPKPKQKISPNQMNQNIKKLKELLKKVFDGVTDNANETDFTENMLIYLNSITCEYAYLMDSQHLKFEINRLNFTYHGSLKNMEQKKQFMMIVVSMIVKILLYRFLSKAQYLAQKANVTDQTKINIKTLTSVVYEIFLLYIRGATAIQPNNTKDLPIENVVKEKKDMYYQLEGFEATEEEKAKLEEAKQKANSKDERIDEPMLYPIYSGREMAAFFDAERQYVSTLQQMVEGWCEKVCNILQNYRNDKEAKRKEELKKRRESINNSLAIKRDRVNKIIQLNKQREEQISQEIEELTNKIAESSENAKRAKENYDQMQRQREERHNNMLLGPRNMGQQMPNQQDGQYGQPMRRQF